MKNAYSILFTCAVLMAGCLVGCYEPVKPNVILILADDQGWGTTSVRMNPSIPESASDFIKTPNLEKLASRGVVFSAGYAPHPNCSPSRAAILTGKSPAALHITDIIDRHSGPLFEGNRLVPPLHVFGLDPAETTIAEQIKNHLPEYATAYFGKWHLAAGGPENHGFDVSHGETGNREGNGNPPEDPKKIFTITRDGMVWMEKMVEQKRPFFLQLSHYANHLAIASRPETLEMVSQRSPGKRHDFVPYAAMSQDLDEGVGMIMNKIRELGIEDRTYIIYLADNGTYPTPSTGNINGPLHGWKATLWEGGIRVPFIIAGPGLQPGYRDEMVTGCDLFPTICDWLGIQEMPDNLEGRSLTGLLEGRDQPNRIRVFHFPHYQHQKGNHPVSAVYQDPYKLLKWYEDTTFRLYRLDNDLTETRDLSGYETDRVNEMNQLLERYLQEIDAGMPVLNPYFIPGQDPAAAYPGVREKLMSLPYFVTR